MVSSHVGIVLPQADIVLLRGHVEDLSCMRFRASVFAAAALWVKPCHAARSARVAAPVAWMTPDHGNGMTVGASFTTFAIALVMPCSTAGSIGRRIPVEL